MSEDKNGYTVPTEVHGSFRCLAQGVGDYSLEVMAGDTKDYGVMMIIGASEEAVYISKQQAAAFFGFSQPIHRELKEPIVQSGIIKAVINDPWGEEPPLHARLSIHGGWGPDHKGVTISVTNDTLLRMIDSKDNISLEELKALVECMERYV